MNLNPCAVDSESVNLCNNNITALKAGTTYVSFDVYTGGKLVSHSSVKVTVQNGGKASAFLMHFEGRHLFYKIRLHKKKKQRDLPVGKITLFYFGCFWLPWSVRATAAAFWR